MSGYAEYLASPGWEQRRTAVLQRDGYRCAGCGNTENLHVHHCTYENFGHEPPGDLITLCESCHRTVHRLHREHGGDLAMATAEALAILRSAGRPPQRAKTHRPRKRKSGKRRAAPLDPAQLEAAQAAVADLLASGVNQSMVRRLIIPVVKGQIRKRER